MDKRRCSAVMMKPIRRLKRGCGTYLTLVVAIARQVFEVGPSTAVDRQHGSFATPAGVSRGQPRGPAIGAISAHLVEVGSTRPISHGTTASRVWPSHDRAHGSDGASQRSNCLPQASLVVEECGQKSCAAAAIPTEIWIVIFKICRADVPHCDPSTDSASSTALPVVFSHVSRRWRSIVLDLPCMWTHVSVTLSLPCAHEEASAFLERARGLEWTLCVRDLLPSHQIADRLEAMRSGLYLLLCALRPAASRCVGLILVTRHSHMARAVARGLLPRMPNVKHVQLCSRSLPVLGDNSWRLSERACCWARSVSHLTLHKLEVDRKALRRLSDLTSLVCLTFIDVSTTHQSGRRVVLPNVHTLEISASGDGSSASLSACPPLETLALPSLQTLRLRDLSSAQLHHVVAELATSSPPARDTLRSCELVRIDFRSPARFRAFMRRMRYLERLSVDGPIMAHFLRLWSALLHSTTPHDPWPHLQTLALRDVDAAMRDVVHIVSRRRLSSDLRTVALRSDALCRGCVFENFVHEYNCSLAENRYRQLSGRCGRQAFSYVLEGTGGVVVEVFILGRD